MQLRTDSCEQIPGRAQPCFSGQSIRGRTVGPIWRSGLATLFCAAGMVAACATASMALPPDASTTLERHVGKIVYLELVTPDLAAAKHFYTQLFGWTYRDVEGAGPAFTQAYVDDRPVAGLVQRAVPTGEHPQPAWLSFIATADIDATTATARQLGAKVLLAPRAVAQRGREAVLADPQGAVFALQASTHGDPPDELVAPGEWIWSSLITGDPDTAAGFYQSLFNYEVFDLPAQSTGRHLVLASDGFARASANSLPRNKPGMHAHWLGFIRVTNAVQMAAKVVALGGQVLVQPRPDRHGGKLAVVADPMGAPFGLMEWPDDASKELSQ